ncbi:metal ABC transporter substrate-binding protein [Isoptericola croceus]|uniref:metal ABC transporter substrate-binding protein n=1 Tax=Isoptericola croceus TaxID=3031406 RepID=UPI0023F827A1|nr:metal ABC transporter substrate-binding protein [Isoptericola croceus]
MRGRYRARTACGVGVGMLVAAAAACAPAGADGSSEDLTVYATTGYLADVVANVAPDATVTTMVGPGGDPHTFQPSTGDIVRLREADLVLWNGLHLEAQMIDQLESLDSQLAVGDHLPADLLLSWPEQGPDDEPLHDPHIWNSPQAWTAVVALVADELAQLDPDRAEEYQQRAQTYIAEIDEASEHAAELLADVPEPRILVTGHDAFAYFGQAYGLDVRATDFLSTEARLSATELSALARMVATEQVPAVFRDNQASPQAITSLVEAVEALGGDVVVADAELYADSLGAEPGVDTYLGVVEHNARTVAEALRRAP